MSLPSLANLTPQSLEAAIGGDVIVSKHIGGGAQGTIFKGTIGAPPIEVAIKLYDPRGLDERITREVRHLEKLDSPSIAKALRDGRVTIGRSSFRYVAWEFIDGTCVRKLVDPDSPLSTQEVARCGREISALLSSLWRDRVIHRDIKPDNLIRRFDGTFVLVDFGLARFTAQSTLSRPGAMIGTPAYMPLEQYRGDKGLTVYSDVFALGVTLIELATGSHPTDWDIASLHRGPAEMLGLESLPAGLRALLCRMVDPVPERRPLPDEVAIEMQKYE